MSSATLPDTPADPAVIDCPALTVNVAEQPVVVRTAEVAADTAPLTVRAPLAYVLASEKLLPVELPRVIAAALSETATLPAVFAVSEPAFALVIVMLPLPELSVRVLADRLLPPAVCMMLPAPEVVAVRIAPAVIVPSERSLAVVCTEKLLSALPVTVPVSTACATETDPLLLVNKMPVEPEMLPVPVTVNPDALENCAWPPVLLMLPRLLTVPLLTARLPIAESEPLLPTARLLAANVIDEPLVTAPLTVAEPV